MLTTDDPEQLHAAIAAGAGALAAQGLVVFPTETVYGVGASAGTEAAYRRLQALKERPDDKPFAIHMGDREHAARYVDTSAPLVRRLLRKVFPGPVTLVVDVSDEVIRDRLKQLGLPPEAASRLYYRNTIGLRCPDHPVAQRLLSSFDGPVVASSANPRGGPPPHDAGSAVASLAGLDVDVVIDGGRCRYAKPSTVVRVEQTGGVEPRITVLREGVYSERYIRKMLRWTMLLVCSGNTCRSPMAEAMARQMLAQARNLGEEDLEAAGIQVVSAGTSAMDGAPASDLAIQTLGRAGLDLGRHRSRALTRELVQEADVIYCMTESHRRAVLTMSPDAAEKAFLLDPAGDIEDPFGADPQTYQRCAQAIRQHLSDRLKEQEP